MRVLMCAYVALVSLGMFLRTKIWLGFGVSYDTWFLEASPLTDVEMSVLGLAGLYCRREYSGTICLTMFCLVTGAMAFLNLTHIFGPSIGLRSTHDFNSSNAGPSEIVLCSIMAAIASLSVIYLTGPMDKIRAKQGVE